MEVTEAYRLAEWVEKEIADAEIIQAYDALITVLNFNAKRQNNQQARPFEDQKNKLLDALSLINTNTLSSCQLSALELIGIRENIGDIAQKKVTEVLSNTLDIAHVAKQIAAMKVELEKGIAKANELKHALDPFVDNEEPIFPEDHVLTRVIFEHDASVQDIKGLRDWSSRWFDIGRGFAIAYGQTPEDVKVIGGARGSLIIELAVVAGIVLPLAKSISMIMDSMVKYREFQLKGAEVRRLKGEHPGFREELEEDAVRWEQRAEQIKTETAQGVVGVIKEQFSDYRDENSAELEKSVRALVDFISKGGEVDCVIPDEADESGVREEIAESMRAIRDEFARIRALKETLLLEKKTEE